MSKYHDYFVKKICDYRENRRTYKKRLGGFAVFFYEYDGKIVAKCKLLSRDIEANTLHSCLIKVANALKRVKKKQLEVLIKR